MTTAVTAIYENGVFKPDQPVRLKESTRVQLLIEEPSEEASEQDAEAWRSIDDMIGFIQDGPAEPVGRDHDRYLYRK